MFVRYVGKVSFLRRNKVFLHLKQSVSPHETECFWHINIPKTFDYDVIFENFFII